MSITLAKAPPLPEAAIAEARAVPIMEGLPPGHINRMRRTGDEMVGPCPVCAGRDRFHLNVREGVFLCRKGCGSGDVIALVQMVDGCSFRDAVAKLVGEVRTAPRSGRGGVFGSSAGADGGPAPGVAPSATSPAGCSEHPAPLGWVGGRQPNGAGTQPATAGDTKAQEKRRQAIRAAFAIWHTGVRIDATLVEAYLAARGVRQPTDAPQRLRFVEALPYWTTGPDGRAVCVLSAPAMLAPIMSPRGNFLGLHMTWIDPDTPGHKLAIPDPFAAKGAAAFLPAKKMRGSKTRGAIRLGGADLDTAHRLVVGEGIETVLSARRALEPLLAACGERNTAYLALLDLGHMGGRAAGRVLHPTEKRIDKRGALRAVQIPDGTPAEDDDKCWIAPEAARELVLLGDGDSEPVRTRLALKRAAARFLAGGEGRTARIAMADQGQDFNDMVVGLPAGAGGCPEPGVEPAAITPEHRVEHPPFGDGVGSGRPSPNGGTHAEGVRK